MVNNIPENADLNELSKFSLLAERWWDPQGEMRPLHEINPLRLDYVKNHCLLEGQTVLDIGCGGGLLTEALAKSGAHATGIDLSLALIAVAKAHAKENQLIIDYQAISAESLAEKHPHSFDVITCMELLEHVPDPVKLIAACAKLIKPNGQIFFSTINRNLKAFLFTIIGAEYIAHLLPKGTHDYRQFIRPSELTQWARMSHLKLIDLTGIRYSILSRKFSLSDDVSANYLMCLKPMT